MSTHAHSAKTKTSPAPVISLGLLLSLVVLTVLFFAGCGPQAFVKGEYDQNVENQNLLNDQWSETDMQVAVKDLVKSLIDSTPISAAKSRPVVMVTRLQNKTSEHIDTQSAMDMLRVELSKAGKASFVDKEAREDVSEEYEYQNAGNMSDQTKKSKGSQIGADFILNGRLDSIVQEVGKKKSVYYKMTLNLTNLKTNIVEWTDQKQIRKLYKKRSVGL